MDELEAQNILRGRIIAKLLEQGVRRQQLSSHDFAFGDGEVANFDDLFIDMIMWLDAEGYIRYAHLYDGTEGEPVVGNIAPTSLSIALLDAEVADGMSTRDLIRSTGNDQSDQSNWSKLGSFFGGVIGGIMTSVG